MTLILTLLVLTGCISIITTDMDTYLQHKKNYRGKQVIFRTTLADLSKRYKLYLGRQIELSAPVALLGKDTLGRWYMLLEKDNITLRAFEEHYGDTADSYALNLLIWVMSEEGEVTVRGKLTEAGIELHYLTYMNYSINTDRQSQQQRNDNRTGPSYLNYRQGYRYY